MNNQTKIIIAGALPVLILLFIIGSVLLPRLFFTPKYDFIYTLESGCSGYNGACYDWVPYKIKDGSVGALEKNPLPAVAAPGPDGIVHAPAVSKDAHPHYPKLYIYHAGTGAFNEISFDQANRLGRLTGDSSAPDGTTISSDYRSHGGIFSELFGGYNYNNAGLYLKNGTWNKEITVRNISSPYNYYDYQNNFRLISWIDPQVANRP